MTEKLFDHYQYEAAMRKNHRDLDHALSMMNPSLETKMRAVRMSYDLDVPRKDIAATFDVTERTLRNWIDRFERDGIDGLRHSDGAGRPPDVPVKRVRSHMRTLCRRGGLTVKRIISRIRKKEGKEYSTSWAKKMLRKLGYVWRLTRTRYEYASTPAQCARWQRRWLPRISRLMRAGFMPVVVDESVAVNVVTRGRQWQDPSSPPMLQKNTGRRRTVMLGALAGDGTHLVMQDDRANSDSFVELLRRVRKKYGKCVIILDNAGYHTSGKVGRYVEGSGGMIKLVYLPPYAPHLSAIEECGRQIKKDVMTGRYYRRLSDLRRAIDEYVGTRRFGLNIFTYLMRSI